MQTSRRNFCLGLSAAALLADSRLGPAWAKELRGRLEQGGGLMLDHEQAVAEGLRRGIGSVEVLAPEASREVVAAQLTSFTFRYTVGNTPIEPGGFIWFTMRHVFQCTLPQIAQPAKAGFVTASVPAGVEVEIVPWPVRKDKNDVFLKAFPWQHPIEVRVKSGTLKPGDQVTLSYGDRTAGGPGVLMQPTREPGFAFRVYVAPSPRDPFLPLADDLVFPIVGGPVERLQLVAPAYAAPNGPIKLLVRAEDAFGNEAVSYSGDVVISTAADLPVAKLAMTAEHRGLATVEVQASEAEGILRYTLSDGQRSARSNPVRLEPAGTGSKVYFGDIHGHTLLSDGRGTPDDFYRYARDVAALDFCALTDHDYMLSDDMWAAIQKATETAHAPGKFVTLHAYEWSGMTDVGGDHNVYFRGTNTKLIRCRSYYDYRNQQTYHGAEPQANHIEDLYNALLGRFPEGEVMVIPHYGGRPANAKWHNPRLERFVEIFSDHRRSHDWAYDFLRRGYRLGILASGDNHTGRPGNGFLHNPLIPKKSVEIGTSLVAVIAPDLTREAIFDALFARHAYATSGDRILLAFTMGNAMMGDEVTGPELEAFKVQAEGTAAIEAIEIWKDGAKAHAVTPNAVSGELLWSDPAPPAAGATAMYWVRVLQVNGEEAISSPIWFTRA